MAIRITAIITPIVIIVLALTSLTSTLHQALNQMWIELIFLKQVLL